MMTNDDDWVPTEEDVRHYSRTWFTESDMDRFLASVRRDAWDSCYHQMVTAPARGVIVTEKSNPYAPERRETPTRQETRHGDER